MTLIATLPLAIGAESLPASGSVHSFAPGWVQDAVFYQIFPERFCNGDTTNDPPGTEPWGESRPRGIFSAGISAGS